MTPSPDSRSPKGEPTDRMREFLGRHVYLTLATRNPDGSQHVVPVVYLFDDGRFHLERPPIGQRMRGDLGRVSQR